MAKTTMLPSATKGVVPNRTTPLPHRSRPSLPAKISHGCSSQPWLIRPPFPISPASRLLAGRPSLGDDPDEGPVDLCAVAVVCLLDVGVQRGLEAVGNAMDRALGPLFRHPSCLLSLLDGRGGFRNGRRDNGSNGLGSRRRRFGNRRRRLRSRRRGLGGRRRGLGRGLSPLLRGYRSPPAGNRLGPLGPRPASLFRYLFRYLCPSGTPTFPARPLAFRLGHLPLAPLLAPTCNLSPP